jgi:hypothetical protein
MARSVLTLSMAQLQWHMEVNFKAYGMFIYRDITLLIGGPVSSVGTVIDYRVDGPRIKSWWGRDFLPIQPPVHEYRIFPGGKVRAGHAVDHSPSSSAEVLEE